MSDTVIIRPRTVRHVSIDSGQTYAEPPTKRRSPLSTGSKPWAS